jgi:hypothetical protein
MALLAAGYLAGLAALGVELRREPTMPKPVPGQQIVPIADIEMVPPAVSSVAVYDEIIERPLFTPQRRPQSAMQTVSAPRGNTIDQIDGYRLTAIIRGYGKTTLLVEDPSGVTQTLHEGDKIGEWQLKDIRDESATIVLDTQQKTLIVHQFGPAPRVGKQVRESPVADRNRTRRPARVAKTRTLRARPKTADQIPNP